MAERFTADGDLNDEALTDWRAIEAFRQAELLTWEALLSEDLDPGARLILGRTKTELSNLRRTFVNHQNAGHNFTVGREQLRRMMLGEQPTALRSFDLGTTEFQTVEKAVSLTAAIMNLAMRRRMGSIAEARTKDELLGALWEVAPGLGQVSQLAAYLKNERENARQSARRLADEMRAKDAARLDEWEQKLQEARNAYVSWARRRSTRWGRLTRSWERRHIEAEARISAVELAYREKMGLKAPVEYWEGKARKHSEAEDMARFWVQLYFPVALVGLGASFWFTGDFLLSKAMAAAEPNAPSFPTSVFIVASAGLASCAGVVFWAGRLLTKLYLSQHHLKQDAEERATMTKTYLALIENNAASDDERQIILNALFRNTPDGIVKEEGGLDPSIAAALGKFLAKP